MTGDPQFTAPDASTAPQPTPFASPAPRRRGRGILIVALFAFLIGLVAMYYLLPALQRWTGAGTTTAQTVAQPAVRPVATQPTRTIPADPATVDALTVRAAALDAQLRAIEGRMATTETASRAAAGQARRAEGLLIAFAARRALDRGLALGYIEGQLRDRFGADQAQAVSTVIATSRDPVTLADLRGGLSRLGPTLTAGSPRDGFFRTLGRELSTLVILRREDTPSSRPDERLTRAQAILDGGNVEGALAEVTRMPGASEAAKWIEAAKRYIDARRALNALELAAIGTALPVEPAATPAPAAPVTNTTGTTTGI